MKKLLTTLAVFFIFLGCGFKPIYKITSDDATLDGYSVEVTNQVAREIIEEVNSTIVPGENQKYKALLNIYEDLTPLIVNLLFNSKLPCVITLAGIVKSPGVVTVVL